MEGVDTRIPEAGAPLATAGSVALDAQTAATEPLLDLTGQQCNLLLMRPLFALELAKGKYAEDEGESRGLLEGIDTHYLALAALGYMMEGTAVAAGYTLAEVQEYVAAVALQVRPELKAGQATRVATVVLDSLDNARNNYQEHTAEYFHAPSRQMRTLRFRLTRLVPDLEDIHRYEATPEGYLVFIGMLNLEVEDHQVLVEQMLRLLIERGRFEQAYEFARRARTLSIEHRQVLRDFILQAWRAPGSINWARDIAPRLKQARGHINERQDEDRRMEESVRERLAETGDLAARTHLARLFEVLRGAGQVRAQLQLEVTAAGDKFMNAQAAAFRPRRPSGLPDLETRLLPDALLARSGMLGAACEDLLASLYPPQVRPVYELSQLVDLLTMAPDEEADADDEQRGAVVPFVPHPDPFPAAMMHKVHAWLHERSRDGGAWTLAQRLAEAEHAGFSAFERQCVVWASYRSFPDAESLFPSFSAATDGRFDSDVAVGDNLRFNPKDMT